MYVTFYGVDLNSDVVIELILSGRIITDTKHYRMLAFDEGYDAKDLEFDMIALNCHFIHCFLLNKFPNFLCLEIFNYFL